MMRRSYEEYAVGYLAKSEQSQSHSYICKEPVPFGSYILVQRDKGFVFPTDTLLLFGIYRKNDTSRNANVIIEVSHIVTLLEDLLRQEKWYYSEKEKMPVIRSRYLSTPYGRFKPIYDDGVRSYGHDRYPRIWFKPAPSSDIEDVFTAHPLESEEPDLIIAAQDALLSRPQGDVPEMYLFRETSMTPRGIGC